MWGVWEGSWLFESVSNVSNLFSYVGAEGRDSWSEKIKLVDDICVWMAINERIALKGRRT
jgi:hypothetical protein